MTPQQAENLRILIRYMETRPVERLDMSCIDHCGTPACAWGHARTLDAFKGYESLLCAADLFGLEGIDHGSLAHLFGQSLLVYRGKDLVRMVDYPTPQQWADEARKVLVEHGYSMDGDDGFVAFKAKLLQSIVLDDAGAPCWPTY